MQKIIVISLILIVLIFGAYLFVNQTRTTQPTQSGQTSLANPASVNCIDQGGKLDIITEASGGGQIGICNFPDGKSCEEWSFFRTKFCKN